MDEPFLLVVNPRAGAGRAGKLLPSLESAFTDAGASFTVATTARQNDATRIVREALREKKVAGIAIVGGDGTLNEAVNGFFDETGTSIAPDRWLAPLPCGTGGDFRRTLGISEKVDAMVTRMLWARPRHVDVGWLTCKSIDGGDVQRAFINISSFGISGLVVELVNESPKWMGAKPAFLLGLVRGLTRYENKNVRVTIGDAEPRTSDVLAIAVANGRFFGGGMMIAPEAKIDDGLFDVVLMEFKARDRSPSQLLDLVKGLYKGEHVNAPGVSVVRATRVAAEPVDPGERVHIDLDGEAPGVLPATFQLRANALLLRG